MATAPADSPYAAGPRGGAAAIGDRLRKPPLLLTYLGPQWRRVLLLFVLVALTIGLQLANPQILRAFIDDATAGASLRRLAAVALLFLGAALALQVAQLGEVSVAENVGLTATNRLRADLTLHVLGLDPSFHASHTSGALIERTDGDVATLGNFFARFVISLVGNALLLVGVLILLAQVDWRIGAVVAVTSAVGIATMLRLRRAVVSRAAALRQATADLFGLIEERLAGTEDIRANGGVAYVLRRLLERSRHQVWTAVGARLAGGAAFHGGSLWLRLGTVAALAVAALLFRRGELTIGAVYLVFAYTESVRRPIESITRQLQDLQQATASISRVRALLAERSVVVDGPGGPVPTGALALELDGVSFGYGSEPVLRHVSFHLEPGLVLGLLGRTGSGKTTVARLLIRLYDPTEGAIRLGGLDVRELKVAALRERIGIVTQEVHLFAATVRDNVTFFDGSISDARVEAALEEVGLGPWLRRLPHGLATQLAPAGGDVSAGEAQLIAFARLFLKDPGLVVLDEASSRLDPATERLLERAVDRLLAGRTAIVIAHRLATVDRADRIVVLDEGRIAEIGERTALAADPGSRLSRLLRVGLEVEELVS